jgi:hypothetical protein
MQIIIQSQYHENYGAHDWDGKGECPQYWKAKGGSEYRFDLPMAKVLELGGKGLQLLVESMVAKHVTRRNNYVEEHMIDWFILEDGESTPGQKEFAEHGFSPTPIEIAA